MGRMSRADLGKEPDEVAGMFDDAAAGYDRSNAILSGGASLLWRIATVRALQPQPGERILDLAAGTGTSSAAIAKTGATVVAVDISDDKLRLAREVGAAVTINAKAEADVVAAVR